MASSAVRVAACPGTQQRRRTTCRVESAAGTAVEGQMLGFDPTTGTPVFRTTESGPVVTLPFSRFSRLTLTSPLQRAPTLSGVPMEPVPAAAQELEYTLRSGAGAKGA